MFLKLFFFRRRAVRRRSASLINASFAAESLEARALLSASATAAAGATMKPNAYVMQSAAASPAASASSVGYSVSQIRTAYGFNNVSFNGITGDGRGQTIAIIDAYNDPNIASDLATFDSQMGVAAPPSFKVVNQTGGTTLPGVDSTGGWEVETALDVEWAHAMAPGANIVLVEAKSASDADLFAAVNYARNLSGVSVVSMSWGSDDNAAYASYDQSLANQYLVTPSGHQGITFVASSGDNGVPSFPATSPNVLAVGGTDLYLTSGGTISSETAWVAETDSSGTVWSGGGGTSKEFAGRNVPDVSYNAGVSYAVYDSFTGGGGWIGVGGTSAGAPQWAAIVAVADQGRAANGLGTLDGATQTIQALYAAPSADFHDITTGSTQFQTAHAGYDLATGLGSPVVSLIAPYLASYGGGGTTSNNNVTAPANVSATAASSTSATVSWSAVSNATGYRVYKTVNGTTSLAATLGGPGTGTQSTTITGLTAGSTVSFYVQAYNSTSTANSSSASVTLPGSTSVGTPTNVKAVATSSTTATISWNAAANATGYRIFYWNGSRWVSLGAVGAGTLSVNITGLSRGSTYQFAVQAFNSTSTSAAVYASMMTPFRTR